MPLSPNNSTIIRNLFLLGDTNLVKIKGAYCKCGEHCLHLLSSPNIYYCINCYETIEKCECNPSSVLSPSYYQGSKGIQAFDIIEQFKLDFFLGTVLKYILRAGKKSTETEIQDLKKARVYLDRKIGILENEINIKNVNDEYVFNNLNPSKEKT